MPKVSVIVPVYNSEKYLSRCVNSILEQTFRDFELILIDDGSCDQSGSICDMFASKLFDISIRVIHQKNGGQSAARNHAVNIASGQWVTFVDGDDYVHPQYLEILYRGISQNYNGISLCNAVFVSPNNIKKYQNFENIHENSAKVDESYFLNMYHSNWNDQAYKNEVIWGKMIPIDIVKQYPLTEGRIYEDSAIMCRWFFEAKNVIEYDCPLYYYINNPLGTMNSAFSEKKLDKFWSLEEMESFFRSQNYKEMEKIIQKSYLYIALMYEKECKNHSLQRKIRKMRRSKAVKCIPFWNENIKQKFSYFLQYCK